jgi:hypothetical protein
MPIEKLISPFISQQFPDFYKDQGPNFIAFVRAYYEWIEQSNNAIGHSRSLLEYNDIDTTIEQFIANFKYQYIQSLPDSAVVDKRLLLKHILDLYRAKGTPRAVELLFRVVFNEDIELYIPNEYIFKPSDNTWKVPRYLEVGSHPNINRLVSTQIQNVGNTSFGIVENVSSRIVNGRTINVLEISSIRGEFVRGDRIYQTYGTDVTFEESLRVQGSLTAIAITQGGIDFKVGDILDVVGSGVEARARVAAISDRFSGSLSFTIADGGSGYTTNAIVTVATTLNLNVLGLIGSINTNDIVTDATTGANGTVISANSSTVKLINFSQTPAFGVGNKLLAPSGNATIVRTISTGSAASFKVGSISNAELITFNTTTINSYLSTALDSATNTMQLSVSSISGSFNANDIITSSANSVLLEGFTSTVSAVANGESLSNTTLGIANLYAYRSDGAYISVTGTDSNLSSANLITGAILISNTTSSVFQLINTPTKEVVNGEARVVSSNSTALIVESVNGYFIETKTITDSNTAATATVNDVIRLTDWMLEDSLSTLDNLDSTINDSLPLKTLEVGTISSLTQINPGSGYLTTPYITVVEPEIAEQLLLDTDATQKGNNAIITSIIAGGNGTVTSVEVIDSGYGYIENENITLISNTNPSLIGGTSIVYRSGRGAGRWLNRKSFTSDIIYIHDGFFYQDYSYQIIAQRMFASYEMLVRDLVHPSGVAMFGAYRSSDYLVSEQDTTIQSSIVQQ